MESEACSQAEVLSPEGIEEADSAGSYILEGKAKIINENKKVFYNPVQEFNRDLSIAVLSVFAEESFLAKQRKKRNNDGNFKNSIEEQTDLPLGVSLDDGISVLEALSATGLRSMRFALEIPGIKEVVANDLSDQAVKAIKDNIALNGVENLVRTNHGDASLLMYTSKFKYDAIDLDPYGSPTRFLDSAVQSVKDNGLLLVTCTDMAVLAGNSPETCYTKYGSLSLRFPPCHEMALRIALQSIESHANRYGRYIQPLICVSVDFYIRLIVKVFSSQAKCKETTSKLSHVYMCIGCKSFLLHPLGVMTKRDGKPPLYTLPHAPDYHKCEHCGSDTKIGGPIWSSTLHDKEFVEKVLRHVQNHPEKYKTERRLEGMLSLLMSELETPLYCTPDTLCAKVHCVTIPVQTFRSALLNGGYKVSESHAARNSVKTNAPFSYIWNIIREWVKDHPVGQKRLEKEPVVKALLSTPPEGVNFSFHPESVTQAGEILRYQVNPLPHWGPGYRATANVLEVVEKKRKEKLQKKKNSCKDPDSTATNTENS